MAFAQVLRAGNGKVPQSNPGFLRHAVPLSQSDGANMSSGTKKDFAWPKNRNYVPCKI